MPRGGHALGWVPGTRISMATTTTLAAWAAQMRRALEASSAASALLSIDAASNEHRPSGETVKNTTAKLRARASSRSSQAIGAHAAPEPPFGRAHIQPSGTDP
jgi:ferric-dicitrate binding protein FerR (iron transport regulator)